MGVKLNNIESEKIELVDIYKQVLGIDAFNLIYQIMSTLRNSDGTPLSTSEGKTSSHILGVFYKVAFYLRNNIKPVFIFDGESPELKKQEREKRKKVKQKAMKQLEIAKENNDIEMMSKFSKRTTRVTKEIIEELKELLTLMGIPYVDSASEGEAQAAYMNKVGDIFAVVSQDYDSVVFGSKIIIRNLNTYKEGKTVFVDLINTSNNLSKIGFTEDDMIVYAMMIGTDFNNGGIPGIGPKTAEKKIKECKGDYETLFKNLNWNEYFDYDWKEVYNIFKNCPVNKEYKIEFGKGYNSEKLKSFLIEKFEFSKPRVEKIIDDTLDIFHGKKDVFSLDNFI